MNKMLAIYKKDLKAYFLSPIAYVSIGLFLMLSGLFFFLSTIGSQVATMEFAFGNMIFIFLIISPILTMKLIAEEKKTGTEQLLLTSPIELYKIVLGKYFAALTIYVITLVITFIYPAVLYYYSRIDLGPIISGYLGLLLIGAAFLSAGIFASSLTENQIIAGIVGYCILLISWSFTWIADMFQGTTTKVFEFLSIIDHFNDFQIGIIDTSHIFYYISYAFVFLFLTVRVIEKRRWAKE